MFLSILSNNEREDFLNLAINMAHIDGDFANAEKVQINAYALEMGLTLKDKSAYNKTNDELIAELSKGNMTKGLMVALFGLALGFVGVSPISAEYRFTFGMESLSDGLNLVVVALGIFGLAEMEFELGNFEQAIQYYAKLDNRDLLATTGVSTYERIGKSYASLGKFEAAREFLEKAIEIELSKNK